MQVTPVTSGTVTYREISKRTDIFKRNGQAKFNCGCAFWLSFLVTVSLSLPASATLTLTPAYCFQCTSNEIIIRGASPGAQVTVKDAKGKVIGTGTPSPSGNITITVPPGTPSPLSATSDVPGDPQVDLLPVIQPLLGTTSRTTMTIIPGSAAQMGSKTYSLTGGFSAVDTNVIYDSTSPNYGDVTGSILASAFDVDGTGPTGSFALRLATDGDYTINLASAWSAFEQPPDTVVPFSVPLTGLASFDGSDNWVPFNGTVAGSVEFSDNLQESVSLDFSLDTQFGTVTGTMLADGTADCPEPASWTLLIVGLLGTGAMCRMGRVK